jgi:hypothetical protein
LTSLHAELGDAEHRGGVVIVETHWNPC